MESTEYEKKYEVTAEQGGGLRQLLGSPSSAKRQVDRYFDTRDALLFRRGIFCRIRGTRFQIKFNLQDVLSGASSGHTECTEVDLPLVFGEAEHAQLEKTLHALSIEFASGMTSPFQLFDHASWVESVVVDKHREVYGFGDYCISLDDVVGLGLYLEVEAASAAPKANDQAAQLFRFIDEAGLTYVDTGYNALYWRKHDWGTYMQSPYVMKRDK